MAFAYAGAVLWVCCFLTIGYVRGDEWRVLVANFHRHLLVAGLVVVAVGRWIRVLKGTAELTILWTRGRSATTGVPLVAGSFNRRWFP